MHPGATGAAGDPLAAIAGRGPRGSVLHVRLPCNKVWPLGAITLAGHVRQHHPHVRQRLLDLAVLPPARRRDYLLEEIRAFRPEVIAISWRDIQVFAPHEADASLENSFNFFYSNSLVKKVLSSFNGLKMVAAYHANLRENLGTVRLLAKNFPDALILLGGGAFSVFHKQLTPRLPSGVIGVIGEGEQVLDRVLTGTPPATVPAPLRISFHQQGRVTESALSTSPPPLDLAEGAIDYAYIRDIFPQWEAYRGHQVSVQTKRGCPYRCAYCLYPYIEGTQVSLRPPQRVLDEMEFLHRHLDARDIWFADAQFLTGRRAVSNAEAILAGIIERGLNITWSGYVRTSSITPGLADLMVRSGVGDLEVGLASGSQRMVNEMQLGFRMDNLYRGAQNLKQAGYRHKLILNFSPNMPGETVASLLETVESYHRFAAIMGEENIYPMIFFIGVQPHTPMEQRLIAEGHLAPDYNPMSLNPWSIKKLLYNPHPLNGPISEACLEAWRDGTEDSGRRVLTALERILRQRHPDLCGEARPGGPGSLPAPPRPAGTGQPA
ncbi:MAG: radical SAM protein [Nitrospirota bacterium]|nr:radical SAM protein [Nitrospirota bacterium]